MNANKYATTLIDICSTQSPATLSRKVIINVDDLGLSEAVNEAVVNLAYKSLITASSYMVAGHIDSTSIKTLDALNIDIGLHLDFTGIFNTTLPKSLVKLLTACYSHRIDSSSVADDIKQQLDMFEDRFNHPPRFIDGHQHVHQIPIIRNCLITELTQRYASHIGEIASRVTYPINYDLKAWVIYALGGGKWQSFCQQKNLATNSHFGGVYDFSASEDELARLWGNWLSRCPMGIVGFNSTYNSSTKYLINRPSKHCATDHYTSCKSPVSVIMCHPAVANDNWQDNIKDAREREYHWMMSGELKQLYNSHDVELTHWHHLYKTPKRPAQQ